MDDDTLRNAVSAKSDSPITRAAASFLGQVLGLGEAPGDLASDLSAIKRDANASIYTIQLESSVGPAAFLVYAYLLRERGGDGRTGKQQFDAGLETLQQAAANNSPGPRAVAHAETDDYGFILATTPGTYRALVGEAPQTDDLIAKASDLLPTAELEKARSESAEDLLRLLREANQHAADWLSAVQGSGQAFDGDDTDEGLIEFTEQETELALFLLDDESIGSLLKALNVLVATAQEQAAAALEIPGYEE
jgi:hypothetical protein